MARTLIPITSLYRGGHGFEPSYIRVTAADGGKFRNDGSVFLHLKSLGTGDATITIETSLTYDHARIDVDDLTFLINSGRSAFSWIFQTGLFNQVDEFVYIDTTQDIDVAALKL